MATTSSPLASLSTNKYQSSTYQYPLDLGTNPELSHYVTFYIDTTNAVPNISSTTSGPAQTNPESGPSQNPNGTSAIPTINQPGNSANANQAITRTNTSISLYMPDLVMADTHTWAGEALNAAGAFNRPDMEKIGAAASAGNWKDAATELAHSFKLGGGDVAAGALRRMAQGINWFMDLNLLGAIGSAFRGAYNSHLEVLYDGPTFRTFQFTFIMTPRNSKEAQAIWNIVHAFRYAAAPDINPGTNALATALGGRYWIYPSEFDISFFSNGKPNTYLNKISTCALTNIQIDYTGGKGWTAYRPDTSGQENTNGVPIQTTLTLQFTELEIITKQRIKQGF